MSGDGNAVNGRRPGALRRVDLARTTGCNLETIRYYEKVGIMPDPPRSPKGYRCYDQRHVDRLNFVMRARALGFSLEEVRSMLTMVDGGAQTCAEVEALASGHLDAVRRRIADLRRIEAVLADMVANCTGRDVPECAVIDALAASAPGGC